MTRSNLRVLFVSHTYVVGVNQGKLQAIAETGTEVGLLAPSNWKALEWNRLLPIEQPYPNIKIYPAPVLFSGRVGAFIYAPWKIWQVLRDFQPDVVQVEQEVFSLCAFELAVLTRLLRKPLVVFGWENQDRRLSWLRRWTRQFVMDTAQLILAGNHDGAKLLRQWEYSGSVEIMPQLGVDTRLFQPQAPKQRSKAFRIGFLGRLVPEKGVDILFAAVQQLQEQGLDYQLVICGSGPAEEELKHEAERRKISDRLLWRGVVPHAKAPEELANFDVLVLPSRSVATWKEQFGHVLIEAMAMGIPVIGSTCGEIPNVIGRSDLVFQEGNAQALAAILQHMIANPTWREEIEHYCQTRAQQLYTHERIATTLIALWCKLLDPSQSSITHEGVVESAQ